jgi:mRNA interferase MazF
MLARFDIVLVAFPFTDGPNVKPRPALVICQSERHQDVLLAFISSKISGAANSDELDIHADHPQFQQSGLKVSSRCRLSRMTTLATGASHFGDKYIYPVRSSCELPVKIRATVL